MVFCPEINSIKLDDNGKIFEINRENNNNEIISEDCHKLLLNIKEDDKYFKRSFLYVKNEEINEELSDRFEVERKLRICVAIEIDDNNNIIVDVSSPCLFCSLPLVGSEKHEFPFIINSPDFEPDSERQSILLNGNKINEKTNKISDPGINKMILEKSQSMYEILLNYICQNNDIKDRYLLARGLRTASENDEINNFNHDWYKKEFIEPMRNILIKYPIVWNGEKFVKITDIYLPMVKYYKQRKVKEKAYKFICKIYNNKVPTFEESLNFENSIWKNDKRIKYTSMNKCTNDLSKYKNMDNLSKKIKNSWEWIDEFLIFIEKHHHDYLKNYIIIPNMNSEFVKLTEELTTCREVPDNMIDCLTKLNNPWKLNHIHKNIIKYNPGTPHNIKFALSEIKKDFEEWPIEKLLILISYIPKEDNKNNEYEKFNKKRQTIYELCFEVWNKLIPSVNDGNLFPKESWDGIDEIIFKKIIEKIENNKSIGDIYSIKFMKKFLECVSQYYPEFRNHSIIPNKNGIFCNINNLYEEINIPPLFKQCMKINFNIDINNELIDDQLISIKSLSNKQKKSIYNYIEILNYNFNTCINENYKKNAARSLIKIIPRIKNENRNQINYWKVNQRNLFEIFEIFTKRNDENIEIECTENLKELWLYVNEYIYNDIKEIIESYKDVSSLAEYLDIEKNKLFEYLNIIIKFSLQMKNKGKIFPNQYEQLCEYDYIYNEGMINVKTNEIELIDEKLKDIAKKLNYDVREHLFHQNIERIPIINNVSEKDVNEKIVKIIEDDPNILKDPKYNDIINRLNELNFKKIRENKFNDEMMYIFSKVYIANIQNRLRELENPTLEDCKRWVWELIQNAKDSIADKKDKMGVDIEIIVKNDKYIFKHNGSPFTNKTLSALLYKFSEGKGNSSESTGRFGTGFLTTHSLSKTVNISGDIITEDGQLKGFNATIYREGDEKELLEGLKNTKNSYKEFHIDSHQWTIYEYTAKTEKNREAGKLGIQNLKNNITKTMVFCPEINSIKLDDNGRIFEINRENNNNEIISEDCHKLLLNIKEDDKYFKRSFLYVNNEEINEELSDRFEVERKLRICVAIEIDDNNNIIVDVSSPCLFCSLPLVGSEKHEFPFIINSPDFEPDSERQSILLNGNKINEKTNKISDPGINKMILEKSQSMYEILLNYICQNDDIKDRYLLARGLRTAPENNEIKNFDHDWYKKEFIEPMRNILIKYPIVWNGIEFIKITDIYLPIVKIYKNDEDKKRAYEFISKIYNNKVPTFEETKKLESLIWKNDNNIKIRTMKKFIEDLSMYQNIDNLSKVIKNPWEWIDELLLFIDKNHQDYLRTNEIIPNMNSTFVKKTKDLTTSKFVPDNMIECLDRLGNSWKSKHIHKKIKNFSHGDDHDTEYAIYTIKKCLKSQSNFREEFQIDKILILISHIPNENEDNFNKRLSIYELCLKVWNNSIPNKNDGNSFPNELWNEVDDFIFSEIIKIIKNSYKLGNIFTLEYMKKFLECASQYYPEFKDNAVVPNKNGIFCKLEDLYIDKIPPLFKECMMKYFNEDLNEELIDDNLISMISLINIKEKNLNDYNFILNYKFIYEDISEQNKIDLSKSLIRIIPKESESEIENQDTNWRNNQRKYFDIYKVLTKINDDSIEIDIMEKNKNFWENINKYIFKEIMPIIENYSNVESLANILNINKQELFEYLNIIINISYEGKIIPNQNEYFSNYSDLFNDGKLNIYTNTEEESIPNELKEISKYLNSDIRNSLIHESIGRKSYLQDKLYRDICEDIDGLIKREYDKFMNEKINNPNIQPDPDFKTAVNSLIESYFEIIGINEAQKYFPLIFPEKENIILNVIYNKETRKKMTELGKQYDLEKFIPTLLENKDVGDMIMKGVLKDGCYLIDIIKQFGTNIFDLLQKNPKVVRMLLNGILNDENCNSFNNEDYDYNEINENNNNFEEY
eukprot:jgi/Orpsp1_1/1189531/evm.model.d7180000072673.1